MKEILTQILETFCPDNVYLQGTLNPDEAYPADFITFFEVDSGFEAFYSNESNRIDHYVNVIYYTSDPEHLATVPMQILKALWAAGFIPQNAGIDVISLAETHTGRAMEFLYPEIYSN